MNDLSRFQRAIVIGGSIAGLLSARVLSKHFAQVILLERDPLPTGPEARKGAPQGRHIHALLEAGRKAMETLFPGIVEELYAAGAVRGDMGRETAWFHAGTWKARYPSDIETVLCTRTLLEHTLRGRVAALPRVTPRYGCSVEEVLADGPRTRVTGVRVRTPSGEEILEAELVVDASGRGSRAGRWLETLGYGQPEEERVGIDLTYTTRIYERSADSARDWKVLIVYPRAPEDWRAGFLSSVEGGRWIVSLSGYFGDHAPTDEQGFLEFARSLARPDIHETLQAARPLSEPVMHKIPSSRWLHYERMERFPEGLILLGDAVCALNPLYGQGMTVIGQQSRLLDELLAAEHGASPGRLRGFSRRFQHKLAGVLAMPWFISTTMDLKYRQARGKRMPGLGLLQWGFRTMLEQGSLDPAACRQFYELMNMRYGVQGLLRPGFLHSFLTYGVKSLFVPLHQRANVTTRPVAPP